MTIYFIGSALALAVLVAGAFVLGAHAAAWWIGTALGTFLWKRTR